jgi:hypothetical protein
MNALVKGSSDEIAWHGVVEKNQSYYLIKEILVYPQTVTGATVVTDQNKYSMWLMEQPDEIFNNLRFQGHSHVNMGVSPSGVDQAWYDSILKQLTNQDYYIFLILNKRGDVTISLYDMPSNTIYDTDDINLSVLLEDETTLNDWYTEQVTVVEKPKFIDERSWGKTVEYVYPNDLDDYYAERYGHLHHSTDSIVKNLNKKYKTKKGGNKIK